MKLIIQTTFAWLILFFAAISTPELKAEDHIPWARFVPSSFQLYYGSDSRATAILRQRMKTGQLVVIETRAWQKKEIDRLMLDARIVGAKVVGYLSIGELDKEDEKRFLKELKAYGYLKKGAKISFDDIFIKKNENFNSMMADVKHPMWQAWVTLEAIRIEDLGLDGLFLDTVDTADIYLTKKEWSLKRRQESVEAMIKLISELKHRPIEIREQKHKTRYIVQNRGLNLIGKTIFVGNATGIDIPGMALDVPHRDNPDAILWEDAYTSQGAWGKKVESELNATQKTGSTIVVTLGYKETFKDKAKFFELSKKSGFVSSWATSSYVLHKELTRMP